MDRRISGRRRRRTVSDHKSSQWAFGSGELKRHNSDKQSGNLLIIANKLTHWLFRPPLQELTFKKGSFFPQTIRDWNVHPDSIIGCGAKVSCILRHRGVQLILAYSWARPTILVGREGMFLFLLFPHFHSCSSFFPVPIFHLFYYLFYLFSPFL